MIHLTELIHKAYINLEPGLYLAGQESSCGKTYLCEMLREYRDIGYPVSAYTYSDLNLINIENMLDINKYKLVFIDRYDMYNDVGHPAILKFVQEGGTVIIDCKESFKLRPECTVCLVEIVDAGVIEVN